MANPFFNAANYLAKNPDVAEAVGTDLELAEQHYFLHGANEADSGANTDRKPAPWFDIEFYRASNEKLADVPADQLFLHFTLHGIGEGLVPMEGVELDAQAYAAANPELVEALGIEDAENLSDADVELLTQHFFAHGYKEGLPGTPEIPGYEGEDPDVDLDELTEALVAYQAEVEARGDFLEEAAENEAVAELLEEAEEAEVTLSVEDAIAEAVEAARGEAGTPGGLNTAAVLAEGYDFAKVTDSALPGMIEDVRAELEDAVDTAQEDVEGLLNVLKTLENRQTNYEAALEAAADTEKALAGEVAKADALTGDETVSVTARPAAPAVPGEDEEDEGTAAVSAAILLDGEVVAEVVDGKVKVQDKEAAANIEGWAALLAAFEADVKADALVVSRKDAFLNAGNNVLKKQVEVGLVELGEGEDGEEEELKLFESIGEFYNEATADADGQINYGAFGAEETGDYLEARDNLNEFNEAVEAYEAVAALATELADHDAAVKAAKDAITELGYEVIDLALEAGAEEDAAIEVIGTEGDDLFVFLGDDASIDLFGEVGEDVLFVGAEYTFGADVENGDASVLEVFFTQDGDDTIVTIEQTAFGTNADTQEINEVTLVGVNAEDLSFVDGYVVIA